jgi:hypothetical protein
MTSTERLAERWWRRLRPIGWTKAEHLKNPTINTTSDVERALARAVARMLVTGKG